MQTPNDTSSSYFESTFDYRSLLPTRNNGIENESTVVPQESEYCCSWMPALTWRERCIGCVTCMLAGYLLSLGSFWRIKDLVLGRPMPFVVNATVGNLIALAGSFFLSGPSAQARKMWHEKRRTATILYIGSLLLTLIVAFLAPFKLGKGFLLLILMIVQYCSITWYCLSYIPFAQDAVKSFLQRYWTGSSDIDY